MQRLKGIDKVSWVRFASVYKDFQDEEQFLSVLGSLTSDKV
jgi:transcriptional regulator NrdR family protein